MTLPTRLPADKILVARHGIPEQVLLVTVRLEPIQATADVADVFWTRVGSDKPHVQHDTAVVAADQVEE